MQTGGGYRKYIFILCRSLLYGAHIGLFVIVVATVQFVDLTLVNVRWSVPRANIILQHSAMIIFLIIDKYFKMFLSPYRIDIHRFISWIVSGSRIVLKTNMSTMTILSLITKRKFETSTLRNLLRFAFILLLHLKISCFDLIIGHCRHGRRPNYVRWCIIQFVIALKSWIGFCTFKSIFAFYFLKFLFAPI